MRRRPLQQVSFPGVKTELYDDPNRYARPAHLECSADIAVFHGYQEFRLTKTTIDPLPLDKALARKQRLLGRLLRPSRVTGRSVLDLGANGGFFAFWTLQSGARAATAVDMDSTYVEMMSDASKTVGFDTFTVTQANVTDWEQPADIVIALALIHWIYSCTAALGTLDAAVGSLSSLTREMLIIEWVAPEDSAISFFGHLGFNPQVVSGPYDLATFEDALDHHFARWERIGEVTPTRVIYAAFRRQHEIDSTCPMPLLHEQSSVLSCRMLTVLDGIEHWSRVYVLPDRVEKQTTGGLAAHEREILAALDGAWFPRVLEQGSEEGSDTVRLERVEGDSLRKVGRAIGSDLEAFSAFAQGCLAILEALRIAGVQHRDIRADNVIVRDGAPVLIDFGWAISPTRRIAAPPRLGEDGRPAAGVFDDCYSMGVMLANLRPPTAFAPALSLMASRDPALRVSDLSVLSAVFDACRNLA